MPQRSRVDASSCILTPMRPGSRIWRAPRPPAVTPQKRGLLCLATGGTRDRFSDEGVYGDIKTVLWPPQRLMLEYLGMTALEPFVAYGAPRVDAEQRAAYLAQWRKRLIDITKDNTAP